MKPTFETLMVSVVVIVVVICVSIVSTYIGYKGGYHAADSKVNWYHQMQYNGKCYVEIAKD